MNGFAFAAIYKDPTPPGPGPNPDGPIIDDEDEKEKDNTTYTISGTSITPFVPFTVTVTASNDKGHGNGGHLQSSFSYEVIDDGGRWLNGTTHTWNLFTRVCDKNIQTVQFAWLISGRTPVKATLNYNCGTMTPAISEDVIIGKTFDFSITFSGHGETCLARNLSDFGATYWWEAQKNNKWERTNRIAVNQAPSFSQGVLSGVANVGNLVGYDKIRLCVDYAGLATAYAEATVTSAEVTITLGDDALHCWGAGTQLKIESDTLEYMTAAFYRGGDTTEDITDTQGDPIVFSFSGTSWQGDIQAAGGATAGTVVLKVMYNGVVQATKEITIETEFLADISVSSNTVFQGGTFDMSGSVASTMGELSRIPANAFKLVAVQGNATLAEIGNTAGSQEVEYEGVAPSTTDIVYVRVIDLRDDTVVAEEEVAVQSIKSALSEAINERVLAKTGTAGTSSESDSANTLRSAAIEAIKNFVKGDIGSDGTYDYYSNSNHGIAVASDTVEWYASTYAIVKSAVSKNVNPTVYDTKKGKRTSGVLTTTHTGSGTTEDPYVLEPESDFKQRAVTACNNAQWDDEDGGYFDSRSTLGVGKTYYYTPGSVSSGGREYSNGYASATVQYQIKQYTLSEYVSGTVDMYFNSLGSWAYDTFGHRAPTSNNMKAKCGSFSVTANIQAFSPWFGTDNGHDILAEISQMSGARGYEMGFYRAFITYNFKHK